jgi:hypothetical protein
VAFGLCYHLGDPIASYEGFNDGAPEIAWGLFRVRDGLLIVGAEYSLQTGVVDFFDGLPDTR